MSSVSNPTIKLEIMLRTIKEMGKEITFAYDKMTEGDVEETLKGFMDDGISSSSVSNDAVIECTNCNSIFPHSLYGDKPCPFCGDEPDEEELVIKEEAPNVSVKDEDPGCFSIEFNPDANKCLVCPVRSDCELYWSSPGCFKVGRQEENCNPNCRHLKPCTAESQIVTETVNVPEQEKEIEQESPVKDEKRVSIKDIKKIDSKDNSPTCKGNTKDFDKVLCKDDDCLDYNACFQIVTLALTDNCFGKEYNSEDTKCLECPRETDCGNEFSQTDAELKTPWIPKKGTKKEVVFNIMKDFGKDGLTIHNILEKIEELTGKSGSRQVTTNILKEVVTAGYVTTRRDGKSYIYKWVK